MTKNVFLLWYIADHEVTKKVRTLTINEIFSQDQYSISYVTVRNTYYFRETISILKIENFDHNCYLAFIAKAQGNDLWLTMKT